MKPYLEKPNPYVPGNTSWLSLFSPSTVPYMTSPNGDIDIILGSNVETGMFYSKEAFTKAGITSAPATWADFMTDLGKLKSAGVTPIMFADGGLCNPSWFERLATSSLLSGQVSKFDVNHAQVTTGLDVAVGINKGIISMNNPHYAEVWKLLGQLVSVLRQRAGQLRRLLAAHPDHAAADDRNAAHPGQGRHAVGRHLVLPAAELARLHRQVRRVPRAGYHQHQLLARAGHLDGRHDRRTERQRPVGRDLAAGRQLHDPGQDRHRDELPGLAVHPAAPGLLDHDQPVRRRHPHGNRSANRANIPGLNSLVPAAKVGTVVDVVLDDVLSTAATNSGLRLVQEYIDGQLPYSSFASQWQSLLTSSAQQWANTNHVDLSKY